MESSVLAVTTSTNIFNNSVNSMTVRGMTFQSTVVGTWCMRHPVRVAPGAYGTRCDCARPSRSQARWASVWRRSTWRTWRRTGASTASCCSRAARTWASTSAAWSSSTRRSTRRATTTRRSSSWCRTTTSSPASRSTRASLTWPAPTARAPRRVGGGARAPRGVGWGGTRAPCRVGWGESTVQGGVGWGESTMQGRGWGESTARGGVGRDESTMQVGWGESTAWGGVRAPCRVGHVRYSTAISYYGMAEMENQFLYRVEISVYRYTGN